MQRCRSAHDEGVLAMSSTSSGRQYCESLTTVRAEAVRRYRQLMTNSRTQIGDSAGSRCTYTPNLLISFVSSPAYQLSFYFSELHSLLHEK